MKRSRIFLGVTTALLAIAGVAAAKTHRAPTVTVFYHLPGDTKCPRAIATKCDLGVGPICKTEDGFTLYTKTDCVTPVHYNVN